MINFQQFLIEIFGSSNIYPWKSIYYNQYRFVTENSDVFVVELKSYTSNSKTTWSVSFSNESISDWNGRMYPASKYSVSTALKIYNTIADIIKTKIKPYLISGDSIYFEAVSARTVPVYSKFASIIAREIGGTIDFSGYSWKVTKL